MSNIEIDLELILKMAEEVAALKPHGFNGDVNGYDNAIVGLSQDGQLVYSIEKMISICSVDGEMTDEEASEFLYFNTFCCYVGEQTPLFIYTGS
jgi:hypothetical protein